MSRPTPGLRLIVTLAVALAATVLFAFSLLGLAGLDGRLETAVSVERSRDATPVRLDERPVERGRDCPEDDRPPRENRLRF